MIRLLVHVEGQTEETFVNKVLAPHLYRHGVSAAARLLGRAHQRDRRGGIKGWVSVRNEIVRHLHTDGDSIATTMVDYYRLPATGNRAWPGRNEASARRFPERAFSVENAMTEDVCGHMGDRFDDRRFVPYLMMHEFEALLFSDCRKFSSAIGQPNIAGLLQSVRDEFSHPEEINDSPNGAPSKRILGIYEGYRKPLMGLQGIQAIGLPKIRAECPHFSCWLRRLENLSAS